MVETPAEMQRDLSEGLHNLESTTPITYDTDEVTRVKGKPIEIVDSGSAVALEQAVIRSLQFESMRVGLSNIPEAHAKTFDWMFEPPQQDSGNKSPDHHFLSWLRFGKGVFWISGKPGSGKSTLMKYLYNHKATKETLKSWVAPRPQQ